MKSFFEENIIVEEENNNTENKALWMYNLSKANFEQLKEHLRIVTFEELDVRDVALYFAEWWKNLYDGGTPSEERVYNSLKPINLNVNIKEFYELAKQGLNKLNIKCIKKSNINYCFRTLLTQGGLPLIHLSNNQGAYLNFLKAVLEIEPTTIDDFSENKDIFGILPKSSRNDSIYESCLFIVKAILNNDKKYLKILEQDNKSLITNLVEFNNRKIRKQIKFKSYWKLTIKNNKLVTRLKFNYPSKISADELKEAFYITEDLKNEYKLFVDNKVICKFTKNMKGDYNISMFYKGNIFWNNEDVNLDVYIISNKQEKYLLDHKFTEFPNTTEPTLWIKNTESEWQLQKGGNCKDEDGFVLYNNTWNTENDFETIHENEDTYFVRFNKEITFNKENEEITFKTNKTSFDWYVQDMRPNWILKSNMPVSIGKPRIDVYIENKRTNNAIINWRLKGAYRWQEYNTPIIDMGCIEYKISLNDVEETGVFYNIGSFKLDYDSNNLTNANIAVTNNNLNFSIEKTENIIVNVEENVFELEINNVNKFPKQIKATIYRNDQGRKLRIFIEPPFKGITVINNNEEILKNNETVYFNNLDGHRLFASDDDFKLLFYNQNNDDIKIEKKIKKGLNSFIEYADIIERLYTLSDTMDMQTSVIIEYNNKRLIVDKYPYLCKTEYDENDKIEISLKDSNENLNLYAIPIVENVSALSVIKLKKNYDDERQSIYYTFPEINNGIEKYIIVSKDNESKQGQLLPRFVYNIKNKEIYDPKDKKLRINNYKKELLKHHSNNDYWRQVIKYFDICNEYEIPYGTFDLLRAVIINPKLITRLFCVLSINDQNDEFINITYKKIESEFGFSFHWVNKNYWDNAVGWILEIIQDDFQEILSKKIGGNIRTLMFNENIEELINWIIQGHNIDINEIKKITHLNTEINNLRARIGDNIINGLPNETPSIIEKYKNILPVNNNNYPVKLLLKTPLAIALSINGDDDKIWGTSSNIEIIRRNMRYALWIDNDWYSKAVLYCINRLNNLN